MKVMLKYSLTVQYPSRSDHLPGRAQKSFEGHIDEVPGVCFLRPVLGGCWGLWIPGARQWHGAYDPVSVET